MKNSVRVIRNLWSSIENFLDKSLPLVDLVARIYIGKVFFMSGLNKIQDWETTIYLFTDEYRVPLLSPHIAAIFGTAGELIFPALLVSGLFTRFAASALFVLNIMAVVAYYATLVKYPAAIQDHLEWGILLALILASPVRQFTLDHLLIRRLS